MRFLCGYRLKDDKGNLVIKTEVHTTKVNNEDKGRHQLLVKLSTEFDLPNEFVERERDIPGILYINPKRTHCPEDLCDLDLEGWETREDYGPAIIY